MNVWSWHVADVLSLVPKGLLWVESGSRSRVSSVRFFTAPSPMAALLEAYLGALRRGAGETIRAALLCTDLRDFTALSEATEPTLMIAALAPGSTAWPLRGMRSAARC